VESYAGFWVTRRSGGVVCRHFDEQRTIQTGIGAVEVERVKLLVEVKSRGLTGSHPRPVLGPAARSPPRSHAWAPGSKGQLVSSGSIVTSTRPCGNRVDAVVSGVVCGNGFLDILECQKQLLGIELLRTPAKCARCNWRRRCRRRSSCDRAWSRSASAASRSARAATTSACNESTGS
jgi:hypothetical protein